MIDKRPFAHNARATTPSDSDIIHGKVCPYCHGKPKLIDSKEIYGVSYGMVWACSLCDAWVGVHKGTDTPLGRLANSKLRALKKEAHKWFDPLWRKKIQQGLNKKKARAAAYKWLSKEMNIDPKLTHIGMFDESECKRVIEILKPLYKI